MTYTSTKDRLPDSGRMCLLANYKRRWSIDGYGCIKAIGCLNRIGNSDYWSVPGEGWHTLKAFTHWAYLPGDPEV